MEICEFLNKYEKMNKCHISFAAGAFSQKKTCSKNEIMRISKKKHEQLLNKCHLFFAAGAFSQNNVQKIMTNMRNSRKIMTNHIKKYVYCYNNNINHNNKL